jgi:hypothetical protein
MNTFLKIPDQDRSVRSEGRRIVRWMPHAGFPLFGEHDQTYRVGNFATDNDDDYLPDPCSAVRAWTIAFLLIGALFVALLLLVPGVDQGSTGSGRETPVSHRTSVAAPVRTTENDCPACSVVRHPSRAGSRITAGAGG